MQPGSCWVCRRTAVRLRLRPPPFCCRLSWQRQRGGYVAVAAVLAALGRSLLSSAYTPWEPAMMNMPAGPGIVRTPCSSGRSGLEHAGCGQCWPGTAGCMWQPLVRVQASRIGWVAGWLKGAQPLVAGVGAQGFAAVLLPRHVLQRLGGSVAACCACARSTADPDCLQCASPTHAGEPASKHSANPTLCIRHPCACQRLICMPTAPLRRCR